MLLTNPLLSRQGKPIHGTFEIDWAHPTLAGIEFWAPFTEGAGPTIHDVVRQYTAEYSTGVPKWRPNPRGFGIEVDAWVYETLTFSTGTTIPLPAGRTLIVATYISVNSSKFGIITAGNPGQTALGLACNGSGNLTFVIDNTASASLNSYNTGYRYYAMACNNSRGQIYVDGEYIFDLSKANGSRYNNNYYVGDRFPVLLGDCRYYVTELPNDVISWIYEEPFAPLQEYRFPVFSFTSTTSVVHTNFFSVL